MEKVLASFSEIEVRFIAYRTFDCHLVKQIVGNECACVVLYIEWRKEAAVNLKTNNFLPTSEKNRKIFLKFLRETYSFISMNNLLFSRL